MEVHNVAAINPDYSACSNLQDLEKKKERLENTIAIVKSIGSMPVINTEHHLRLINKRIAELKK